MNKRATEYANRNVARILRIVFVCVCFMLINFAFEDQIATQTYIFKKKSIILRIEIQSPGFFLNNSFHLLQTELMSYDLVRIYDLECQTYLLESCLANSVYLRNFE